MRVGCGVGISCTLGPHNERKFDDVIEWIIDVRPNTVGFGLPHGDSDNYAMGLNDRTWLYQKVLEAFMTLQQHGVSLIQVERKLRDMIANHVNAFECRACHKRLVICPGKKIGVCEGAVTDEALFFNSIDQAKESALSFQETSPLRIKPCQNCIALRVCGGGCPYDKIKRYGRIDVPDKYRCGFMQLLCEFALQQIAQTLLENTEEEMFLVSSAQRDFLLDNLLMAKENFVPLAFNCEAKVDETL